MGPFFGACCSSCSSDSSVSPESSSSSNSPLPKSNSTTPLFEVFQSKLPPSQNLPPVITEQQAIELQRIYIHQRRKSIDNQVKAFLTKLSNKNTEDSVISTNEVTNTSLYIPTNTKTSPKSPHEEN